ncbi:hypothetical protein BDW02DRAFT_520007 [Decorospora gaudefroyi]|uniref:Uncharacterized protein n=1 Tax=Decorospora gaudefroyi TaxID=184978 RepID=A0A6A5KTJ3_9PLEO|nr:hypothetical protein BDW02DRAFT_520007 [Decorospora gaudefroyi]
MDAHTHSSRCSTPTTPSTPSSPSSQSYFNTPPSTPQIPYHIIVTFDGKVREMLRIARDSEQEQERKTRWTARPRYYARSPEEEEREEEGRPEIN